MKNTPEKLYLHNLEPIENKRGAYLFFDESENSAEYIRKDIAEQIIEDMKAHTFTKEQVIEEMKRFIDFIELNSDAFYEGQFVGWLEMYIEEKRTFDSK